SRSLPPSWRSAARGSTRCRFPTVAGTILRVRRSGGGTASALSGASRGFASSIDGSFAYSIDSDLGGQYNWPIITLDFAVWGESRPGGAAGRAVHSLPSPQ